MPYVWGCGFSFAVNERAIEQSAVDTPEVGLHLLVQSKISFPLP